MALSNLAAVSYCQETRTFKTIHGSLVTAMTFFYQCCIRLSLARCSINFHLSQFPYLNRRLFSHHHCTSVTFHIHLTASLNHILIKNEFLFQRVSKLIETKHVPKSFWKMTPPVPFGLSSQKLMFYFPPSRCWFIGDFIQPVWEVQQRKSNSLILPLWRKERRKKDRNHTKTNTIHILRIHCVSIISYFSVCMHDKRYPYGPETES